MRLQLEYVGMMNLSRLYTFAACLKDVPDLENHHVAPFKWMPAVNTGFFGLFLYQFFLFCALSNPHWLFPPSFPFSLSLAGCGVVGSKLHVYAMSHPYQTFGITARLDTGSYLGDSLPTDR